MKIEIPLNNWIIGKKKYNLSMNTYRNLHHQVNNRLKKMVSEYLLQYRFNKYGKISIEYTVYFKDKRKRDLMNFVAVVDKFVLDHLVNIGSLKDDSYAYVYSYNVKYGGIAAENKIVMQIIE